MTVMLMEVQFVSYHDIAGGIVLNEHGIFHNFVSKLPAQRNDKDYGIDKYVTTFVVRYIVPS